jgi:hypothetical protein
MAIPQRPADREEVIIVAADATSWLVEGFTGEARNREALRREKRVLNIFRGLQVLGNRPLDSGVEIRLL